MHLAWFDTIMGADDEKILATLDAAKAVVARLGWPFGQDLWDQVMAGVHLRRGEVSKARDLYEKVTSPSRNAHVGFLFHCLGSLADPSHGMYEHNETFQRVNVFLSFGWRTKRRGNIFQALRYLGDLFVSEGEHQTALAIFRAALDVFTEMDIHCRRADCILRIGNILFQQDGLEEGREMRERARLLFIRPSQMKSVQNIDEKLLYIAAQYSSCCQQRINPTRPALTSSSSWGSSEVRN